MRTAFEDNAALERSTVRRITSRLIPFLAVLYVVNFLDRTNVGFAALRMRADVGSARLSMGWAPGSSSLDMPMRLPTTWRSIASVPAAARPHPDQLGHSRRAHGVLAKRVAVHRTEGVARIAERDSIPESFNFLSRWFPARIAHG